MCCTSNLKILMCIVNGVIFLLGGAILAIMYKTDLDKPENMTHLLLAVGAGISFTGFMGSCGALCNNKGMLATFFLINLVAFLLEAIVAVTIMFDHPVNVGSGVDTMVKLVKKDYLLAALAICLAVLEVGAMAISIVLFKSLGGETSEILNTNNVNEIRRIISSFTK